MIDNKNWKPLTKLYTFLDNNEDIIVQVRAENHDIAVDMANAWRADPVTWETDFYSETIYIEQNVAWGETPRELYADEIE